MSGLYNRIRAKRQLQATVSGESGLKLRVEFDDTHRLFGLPRMGAGPDPDILGAIFFDEARIVIDESLDPDERPAMEGRYRFTLAHEAGGHWRIHRAHFASDPTQMSLFDGSVSPPIVCRASRAKERIEWQADFYASCLLMPRALVLAAWREQFGDLEPRVVGSGKPVQITGMNETDRYVHESVTEKGKTERRLLDLSRPLAKRFLVSPIAMRIRLQQLGLLRREPERQRSLITGSRLSQPGGSFSVR